MCLAKTRTIHSHCYDMLFDVSIVCRSKKGEFVLTFCFLVDCYN